MVQCYVNGIHKRGCASEKLGLWHECGNVPLSDNTEQLAGPKGNEYSDVNTGPENNNRSLQAKNRQQYGRTKIVELYASHT